MLRILKKTESALNFGISQIIGPLVALVLLPFVGGVVDKYNKNIVIVIAQLLRDNGVEVVYLEDLMTDVLRLHPELKEQFLMQWLEEGGVQEPGVPLVGGKGAREHHAIEAQKHLPHVEHHIFDGHASLPPAG